MSSPPRIEVVRGPELPLRVLIFMRMVRLRLWLATLWITRDRNPRRWAYHFILLRGFEQGFYAEVERHFLLGPDA